MPSPYGYNTGHIMTRHGNKPLPVALAVKSWILVLGDLTLTNPLLLVPFPTQSGKRKLPKQNSTTNVAFKLLSHKLIIS
jgi:hypothetical protein